MPARLRSGQHGAGRLWGCPGSAVRLGEALEQPPNHHRKPGQPTGRSGARLAGFLPPCWTLTPAFFFLSRSQLQTPSSYGPVLSPMNKVHGGGINKLPSVNQLVGQPPQHSSSSAPSLGPMGKVPPMPRAAGPAAERRDGETALPARGGPACPAGSRLLEEDRVVLSACVTSN